MGTPTASGAAERDGQPYLDLTTGNLYLGRDGAWGSPVNVIPEPVAHAADRVYDVRDYGAAGNGSADDTAAITAAINAASQAGGGTVWLASATYLISATLSVPAHVNISGRNDNFWGGGGCTILCAPALSGSAVSVTAGACAISGIAFASTTSIRTPIIAIDGAQHVTLRNIYASGTGGVIATHAQYVAADNVDLQGWNGSAGFLFTDSAIITLRDCNSAAAGTGTTSEWTYGYEFDGCETVLAYSCECNDVPYVGVSLQSTNDTRIYDLELNGAVSEQLSVTSSTDAVFDALYCAGESATPSTGLAFTRCSTCMVRGAWIFGASGTQVVFCSCTGCAILGSTVQTTMARASGLAITDDGAHATENVRVDACDLNGDAGCDTLLTLGGTTAGARVTVHGTLAHGNGAGTGISVTNAALEGVAVFDTVLASLGQGFNIEGADHPVSLIGNRAEADVTTPISANDPRWVEIKACTNLGRAANHQTGSYTLQTFDAFAPVEIAANDPAVVTVPPNTAVPWPIGTRITIDNLGAAPVTIAPAPAVTLRYPASLTNAIAPWASCELRQYDVNSWMLTGALTAAT